MPSRVEGSTINQSLWKVSIAGSTLLATFVLIAFLCESSSLAGDNRFVVPVVVLLGLASVVATLGLSQALRIEPSGQRKLLFVIVCFAISLRGVAIFTPPILEVDFYRYLWDGKALASGVSPYAYSPAQVLAADNANVDSDYHRVVSCSIKSESNLTILTRVHFPNYTTIYPPVSQFVFAASMKWFPAHASVTAHVLWIKLVLVTFDLATMVLLIKLLSLRRRSLGWLIGYAWNPLVIKEIGNSAHLDSIAVFFTISAVYFAAVWIADPQLRRRVAALAKNPSTADSRKNLLKPVTLWPMLSGLCLGLGFGAKLFPIVLAPLFVVVFAKTRWAAACNFLIAMLVVTAGCIWIHHRAIADRSIAQQYFDESSTDQISSEGLESFFSRWRMNDVIFSGIYHNLKPDSDRSKAPWFVMTPNGIRETIVDWFRYRSLGGKNPAFFLTRLLTMTAFAVFYAWTLLRAMRSPGELEIERFAWVMSIFLFLQPTVNPWYWVWVAPLACFSNSRGWLLVSGLLSAYYLRFWLQDHSGGDSVGAVAHTGQTLFDHRVAWLEFAAILTVAIGSIIRSRKVSPKPPI